MTESVTVLNRLLEVRAELDYLYPMLHDAEKRLYKISEARAEAVNDVVKLSAQVRDLSSEHDELARLNGQRHD